MPDLLELIQSRRTVKNFLPKFVSWENIAKVIDAARHAPSSGNIQNWKFIIFIDQEKKQALAKACFEQYDMANAGALIVVCAEHEKAERYYGERGRKLYSIQNGAAAIQNMLLEAHSLGLGAQWVGAFDDEQVRSLTGIPVDVEAQAVIAVGYAKEIPSKPPKYPLETLVYFHSWRSKMRDPAKYMMDVASILARKAGHAKQSLRDAAKELAAKIAKEKKE